MHFFVEKRTNANIFKLFNKGTEEVIYMNSLYINRMKETNLIIGIGMDLKFFGVLKVKIIHIQ